MLGDTGDKGLVAAKMSGEYEAPVLSGCQRVIWGLGSFGVKVSESIEEQCQPGIGMLGLGCTGMDLRTWKPPILQNPLCQQR